MRSGKKRPQSRTSGLVRTDNQEIRFISFANRMPGDPEKAAAMYEAMEDIFRIGDRERSLREPDLLSGITVRDSEGKV